MDINVKPGETVIVAPATGSFGSAAVKVALAMGARVIAVGRSIDKLQSLASTHERIEIVRMTGDVHADMKSLLSHGPIDAFFDISPPEAMDSTHFKTCILALGNCGRVSFMGGVVGKEVPVPIGLVMAKNLQLKGKWMFSRQDVKNLIKLVECEILDLHGQKVERFALDDWEKGFAAAAGYAGSNTSAVMAPWT